MKKLILVFLVLGSLSGFTAERSVSECAITVNQDDQIIYLTNQINEGDRTLNGNCLEAAKYVLDLVVLENTPNRRAKGILIDYREPAINL